MNRTALLLVVLALTAQSTEVWAGPFSGPTRDDGPGALPPAAQAAELDEQLGRPVDLGLVFEDHRGVDAPLAAHFHRGRPVVLLLAYYHCPMLCGLSLRGLVKAVRDLPWALGEKYDVVTLSFDPADGPSDARGKRASVADALSGLDAEAWPFLVGSPEAIGTLTEQVGFRYGKDPSSGQYAHPAAIVVLTPEGVISRYLYGVEYSARDLRLALLDASAGRIGGIVDRILMTCYRFDPASHRYAAFIAGFMRVGAGLILLAVVLLLGLLYGKERQRSRRARLA